MAKLSYWIKERHNPQLGVYYVLCGQMPVKEAEAFESPLYGNNVMHRYRTEKEYNEAIESLEKAGAKIHG